MYASQKINTDPTPLYKVLMYARNGVAAEWAMRSSSEDTAIETALDMYPRHDLYSVSVIYNRPEYDNNPNPLLEAFRTAREHSVSGATVQEVAREWLEAGLTTMRAPIEWGHIVHARKVLERIAAL